MHKFIVVKKVQSGRSITPKVRTSGHKGDLKPLRQLKKKRKA